LSCSRGHGCGTELNGYFLHEQLIAVTISIADEYGLSYVAAKDDVIESAGEVYA
jgi:hypothetical protein